MDPVTKIDTPKAQTFADILNSILTQGKVFRWFLGLIVCMSVIILLLVLTVFFMLGGSKGERVKELQFSTTGTHVIFESTTTDNKKEYLVVVHPQGWQNSGIDVKKGDHMKFIADGRVNVDLWGIYEKARLRHEFEDQITKSMKIDPQSTDPAMVPERYYTPDQRAQLKLLRPWTGPEGNAEITVYKNAFAARRRKRMIPDRPLGALIGAITIESKQIPDRSDAFFIGRNFGGEEYHVMNDGELWFSINDVWDDDDPDYKNMFYDDNVGYFWVKIVVTPGR